MFLIYWSERRIDLFYDVFINAVEKLLCYLLLCWEVRDYWLFLILYFYIDCAAKKVSAENMFFRTGIASLGGVNVFCAFSFFKGVDVFLVLL